MRKLGIYVQVPFCQTKCTYCNFHTGVVASSRFAPYVEAVCGEIREHRDLLRAAGIGEDLAEKAHSQEWLCHEAVVDTVYIGGGAPGPLDPAHFPKIFGVVSGAVDVKGQGGKIGGGGKGGGAPPPH